MGPTATTARAATWLPCIALATMLAAQEPSRPAPPEVDAQTRAAVLRATVVLRIAPYITRERPPERPPDAYRIAVVGTDGVAAIAAQQLGDKKVDGRPIQVATIGIEDAKKATRAAQYDMLYIAGSVDAEARKTIVAAHADRPVVLVCEAPGFVKGGGGVQLFVKDNHVRFDANAAAMQKQGLRADAHLLKLAKKGPE